MPSGPGLEPLTRVAAGPTSHYYNVVDYGADPTGVADSTPAFQTVLNIFKYDSAIKGGRIIVPTGTYNITGLVYEGNFDHGFVMQGDTEGEGGATDGPWLKYTGSAGGTLLLLKGANWCRFEDINFNGDGLALICVDVQYDSVRSISSFDCTWRHCSFGGAAGTDSMCMRWGTSNFASAEHRALDCRFISHSTAGTTYCGIGTTGSSNTKNHTIERCRFINLKWGILFSNSGYHNVIACSFAGQTEGDVKPGGGQVLIEGCGSEGSKRLVDGSAVGSGNSGALTISDTYFAGPGDSNGYVVIYLGSLNITNSDFWTGGSAPPKFKVGFGDTGGQICSTGNYYSWDAVTSSDFIPFYDSSDRHLGTLNWGSVDINHISLRSEGDKSRASFLPVVTFPTWDIGSNVGCHSKTIVAADWPGFSTAGLYPIAYGDATIFAEGATGPFGSGWNVVSLPSPVNGKNHRFLVYKTDSGAFPVGVSHGFGANIEGGWTWILLTHQHDFVELQSDGTLWRVLKYRIGEFAGSLTIGGGGTVTRNWQNPFPAAPLVLATDTNAAPAAVAASSTTTVLTLTGTATHVVNYMVARPL